ncbi:MAG: nickel-dependent hydrogenase large subunit [Candidatus Korarchaeum sp.]|nr:nickel-dependent hydrogenase large subunit [Candidatus Korarchaeum sp.]
MVERELFIDPITRIEGHLGVKAIVDESTKKIREAWSFGAMFRGFEVFLRGREPPDAIHLTSRVCGVCAASHANASAKANDMALGAVPKPFGVLIRNLAWAALDHIYDNPTHLSILAGPDYSGVIVSRLTPSVYGEAKRTKAEHSDVHGFSSIGDIMDALNPLQGKIYILALQMQKIARQMGVLFYGSHPHPRTLIPGGIGATVTEETLIEYSYRLTKLTAWAKFIATIWEDLANFYNSIGYERQGITYEKPNLISVGIYEDPEAYSSLGESYEEIYKNIDDAGRKRYMKPGLILDGELVTDKLTDMNLGTIELVDSSFYDEWDGLIVERDPLGNKLVWGMSEFMKYHPWNKTTIPRPQAQDWRSKYSWGAIVRFVWKGKIYPIEAGPIARMWAHAIQNGGKVKIELPQTAVLEMPQGTWDKMTLEWNIPKVRASTTIERMRARAFNFALHVEAAWNNLLAALEHAKSGSLETSRPWKKPAFSLGFGFDEAPRGSVRHWMVVENYKIKNYQIHAPTTPNLSPRDRWGYRGPYEASVLGVEITEELPPDQWTGLDIVRAIRSFDPCIACAVHMFVGNRRIEKLFTPIATV